MIRGVAEDGTRADETGSTDSNPKSITEGSARLKRRILLLNDPPIRPRSPSQARAADCKLR